MSNLLKNVLDKLDLSYAFFYKNKGVITKVLLVLVAFYVLRYVYRRVSGNSGKDLASVVKYLLSDSARHIDTAVNLRNTNPLQAYEHAVLGSVMARTAKDLTDNKDSLSKELKVDVYKYLEYTNHVTSQIKQTLR